MFPHQVIYRTRFFTLITPLSLKIHYCPVNIFSINRFFAPLRFAQKDKALGFLGGLSWRLRRQLSPPPIHRKPLSF